jgi:hypothetical protein
MFLLNDKPLSPDTPFTTDNGTQYPANWLRLASVEEREDIGITEVPDPVRADDRFYWNGDINTPKALEDVPAVKEDGTPLYVQRYDAETEAMVDTDVQVITKGLKSVFIAQVKQTAASLLATTDWKVTRAAEGIKPVDADTLAARAAIRAASDANEAAITACTTVAELAAIQFAWPDQGAV